MGLVLRKAHYFMPVIRFLAHRGAYSNSLLESFSHKLRDRDAQEGRFAGWGDDTDSGGCAGVWPAALPAVKAVCGRVSPSSARAPGSAYNQCHDPSDCL